MEPSTWVNTILLILVTAVVGIWYARYEGFNTLKSGMSQLVKNELPLYEMVSGAAIAFAALLLILPGFATDIIGIPVSYTHLTLPTICSV